MSGRRRKEGGPSAAATDAAPKSAIRIKPRKPERDREDMRGEIFMASP
jgi:hypothetical protein